jgi:hypothetical protein
MRELRVPFGILENGPMVAAKNAARGTQYTCPGCGAVLVLKDGPSGNVTKHFSHAATGACSQESIYHAIAKRLLIYAIETNAAGTGETIKVHGKCCECGGPYVVGLPPGTFTGATDEERVGRYSCDVAGFDGAKVRLALEVLHTHATTQVKISALPFPMIELVAEDVLADPFDWRPVRDTMQARRCDACKSIRVACRSLGMPEESYSTSKANADRVPYIAAMTTCYRESCRVEIPVFWWRGVPFCQHQPPSPKPRTIKRRQSQQWGGSYWANTCDHCGALQGDNHVFLFSTAPLAGLPLNNDNLPEHAAPRVHDVTNFFARNVLSLALGEHARALERIPTQQGSELRPQEDRSAADKRQDRSDKDEPQD